MLLTLCGKYNLHSGTNPTFYLQYSVYSTYMQNPQALYVTPCYTHSVYTTINLNACPLLGAVACFSHSGQMNQPGMAWQPTALLHSYYR